MHHDPSQLALVHSNLAALQADEEGESGQSRSQGGTFTFKRSDPNLDITEIGEIHSDNGTMEAEGV